MARNQEKTRQSPTEVIEEAERLEEMRLESLERDLPSFAHFSGRKNQTTIARTTKMLLMKISGDDVVPLLCLILSATEVEALGVHVKEEFEVKQRQVKVKQEQVEVKKKQAKVKQEPNLDDSGEGASSSSDGLAMTRKKFKGVEFWISDDEGDEEQRVQEEAVEVIQRDDEDVGESALVVREQVAVREAPEEAFRRKAGETLEKVKEEEEAPQPESGRGKVAQKMRRSKRKRLAKKKARLARQKRRTNKEKNRIEKEGEGVVEERGVEKKKVTSPCSVCNVKPVGFGVCNKHSKMRKVQCQKCKKIFSGKEEWDKARSPATCRLCDSHCGSLRDIHEHLEKTHHMARGEIIKIDSRPEWCEHDGMKYV